MIAPDQRREDELPVDLLLTYLDHLQLSCFRAHRLYEIVIRPCSCTAPSRSSIEADKTYKRSQVGSAILLNVVGQENTETSMCSSGYWLLSSHRPASFHLLLCAHVPWTNRSKGSSVFPRTHGKKRPTSGAAQLSYRC